MPVFDRRDDGADDSAEERDAVEDADVFSFVFFLGEGHDQGAFSGPAWLD